DHSGAHHRQLADGRSSGVQALCTATATGALLSADGRRAALRRPHHAGRRFPVNTPHGGVAQDAALPTHREILAIAVPIMISNVSTPLLGVVDTAVMGRIPEPAYIGAVALGALIFNFVFWAFGFLRMGTTGLTAQALGAADATEIRAALGRALLIGVVVGGALIVLQAPIREAAFVLLDAGRRLEPLVRDYYDIRIWAAPATLANYALLGWFIGLGRAPMAL